MYASAQSEGLEINKRYDELLEKAQDALEKLNQFETIELGMHQEKTDEQNESE